MQRLFLPHSGACTRCSPPHLLHATSQLSATMPDGESTKGAVEVRERPGRPARATDAAIQAAEARVGPPRRRRRLGHPSGAGALCPCCRPPPASSGPPSRLPSWPAPTPRATPSRATRSTRQVWGAALLGLLSKGPAPAPPPHMRPSRPAPHPALPTARARSTLRATGSGAPGGCAPRGTTWRTRRSACTSWRRTRRAGGLALLLAAAGRGLLKGNPFQCAEHAPSPH